MLQGLIDVLQIIQKPLTEKGQRGQATPSLNHR